MTMIREVKHREDSRKSHPHWPLVTIRTADGTRPGIYKCDTLLRIVIKRKKKKQKYNKNKLIFSEFYLLVYTGHQKVNLP